MTNDFSVLIKAVLDASDIGKSDIAEVQKVINKYTLNLTADLNTAELLKSVKAIVPELEAVLNKITGVDIKINDDAILKTINQITKETQNAIKQAAKEQEKTIANYNKQELEYQKKRQQYLKEGTKQAQNEELLQQSMEYYEKEKNYQEQRAKYLAEGKAQQEAYNAEVKETAKLTEELAKSYQSIQDLEIKKNGLNTSKDTNEIAELDKQIQQATNDYNTLLSSTSKNANFDSAAWNETKTAIDATTQSQIEYNNAKQKDNLNSSISSEVLSIEKFVVLQIKWSFFSQIILNYFRNVAYYICMLPVTGYADYLLLKIPHAN